ncbi:MAG: TonB-dependent receptor [Opitutaceae bacterium]
MTLDQFVTSATPLPRNQVDVAQSTTVLSGNALRLKQQPTLGETLFAETGISATSFGPGASRPIIRGLGGDRIRLLENSVGTVDASVTSPDHAVSIEPFLVERIEVLRGPASLLYGSSAVGGVVNVITHRIETDLPAERLRGGGEVRGSSVADEFSRGGVVDFSLLPAAERAVVLHIDGSRRTARDMRIPGFAESAPVRVMETAEALEQGQPRPDFARGRLPNSALDTRSGAIGLSYVSSTFHVGASHSGYESNYGVPGHAHEPSEGTPGDAAGVRIDLRQRRTDAQAEWHGNGGVVNGARFKFGHARYRHDEVEPDGTIGTHFANEGFEGRVELLHGDGKPVTGALGAQFAESDFSASGDEAFLPASVTRSQAVFAFEEIAAGTVTWQIGGRLERNSITAKGRRSRAFQELSGSAGAVWKLAGPYTLAASAALTGRAPNAQELFADGPHAGTQAFEIGDANLETEQSLGLELTLRRRTGFVTGAVTVYLNRFHGYILEQPDGLLAFEHDGGFEFVSPADGDEHASADGLPVYRYAQRDAQFWGAEWETVWHLHDKTAWQLDLRLAADFTRATEGGRNLPRIPAGRVTAALLWANTKWTAGLELQHLFPQRRVAPNEMTTGAYTLVSAHLSRALNLGAVQAELFLRATNLANQEARPHPSFVRHLAPLAARAIAAGVRLSF